MMMIIIIIFICLQIKIHDANKEQMIKPEPHLLLPLNRKRKKTQNLHNTLQLNTMEENITVIKTTMMMIMITILVAQLKRTLVAGILCLAWHYY